jgi:hypothetical protein
MLSKEVTNAVLVRATKGWGVAGRSKRRTVMVVGSTRDGDVVRRCIREERSVGWSGISGRGVWWRWWEQVHGLLVARGFALRIGTAVRNSGIRNSSCSNSSNSNSNIGCLRVKTGVNERHLLKDHCERIWGRKERTLLRVGVRGISTRGRRRVPRTGFFVPSRQTKERT